MDAGLHAPNFGSRPGFTLGVEEELLVVDAVTRRLAPVGPGLVAALEGKVRAQHELFAALVELVTPVCLNAGEAQSELAAARAALAESGGAALGAGLHPDAAFGDAPLVQTGRYALIGERLAGVLRTPTAALQVHVGMPDAETAVKTCNRMRRHVPMLQALAANSPFWHGRDSGLASARSAVLRSYPRCEIPRAFADYADFVTTAEAVTAAADVPDYTFLWWEIRPHPRLGTLEVRCMDAQASLATLAGLAALVHGLAAYEAAQGDDRLPCREALAESSFRAAREGLRARLVDRGGRCAPARALAAEALALARPHARELGSEAPLEEIERILREGNGADRQRDAYARGGMEELLGRLMDETGVRPAARGRRRPDPSRVNGAPLGV